MANNRIYLFCKGCDPSRKDGLYLGKRYKDGYYLNEPESLGAKHAEWFDRHKQCGWDHDHFELGYELPPNYDMAGPPATLEGKLRASGR